MGVVFFVAFMGFLFISALFFIILSTSSMILINVFRKKGKFTKKRWIVIPVIILVFNILVGLIPVGFFAFMRYQNNHDIIPVVYAKSGEVLFWPIEDEVSTYNWFEIDGVKYVSYYGSSSEIRFQFDLDDSDFEEPVANITDSPEVKEEEYNLFGKFMMLLLAGRTKDKPEISTVYPLKNDKGVNLFVIDLNHYAFYCPESNLDSIKAYYNDFDNYDLQNLSCKYNVYTDENNDKLYKKNDTPFIEVETNFTIKSGIFEEIYGDVESKYKLKHFKIPDKYVEIEEKAEPGSPVYGFEERKLYAKSYDGKAFIETYTLMLIDGQVYIEYGAKSDYISGYLLPSELNQYLIDTVFAS